MSKSNVLVITGCASPDEKIPVLALKDQKERKKQYIESIKYYIKNTRVEKIIYCDNSNFSPVEEVVLLAKEENKKFEWLHFMGDFEKSVRQGKGYGECEILKYILKHSQLITENDYMIKVTGRLCVKNIDFLILLGNEKPQFIPYHTENHKIYFDTRIYMMSVDTYKSYFIDIDRFIDDNHGVYLEHAFGICVRDNEIPYNKFKLPPWIEGISGSTGTVYKPTSFSYLKAVIKLFMFNTKKKEKNE